MKEQLISFETAKLAKEKGFNQLNEGVYYTKDKEHCLVGWGFNDRTENSFAQYSAPTQSLLQKWLRELGIIISIMHDLNSPKFHCRITHNNEGVSISKFYGANGFNNYEDCLEFSLLEGLNLIP